MDKNELVYFFEGKSKNRRVNLYVVKGEELIFLHLKTKLLVDRKKRRINTVDQKFTYATFRAMFEMFETLLGNDDFKKLTEKHLEEMKDDVMEVRTNATT